jgi:hypothetical protein
MHLSKGQLGMKGLQLVIYPIYFTRIKSSFQHSFPKAGEIDPSALVADLAATIPSETSAGETFLSGAE